MCDGLEFGLCVLGVCGLLSVFEVGGEEEDGLGGKLNVCLSL